MCFFRGFSDHCVCLDHVFVEAAKIFKPEAGRDFQFLIFFGGIIVSLPSTAFHGTIDFAGLYAVLHAFWSTQRL